MGTVAAGFIAAFAVSALFGAPIIAWLKKLGAAQTVSEDAPDRHKEKQGTTTMGGLLILAGLAAPMLAYVALAPQYAASLGLLALALANGAIGFLDDLLIARRGKNLGLKARQKLFLQSVVAIAFCVWLYVRAVPGVTTHLKVGGWDADLSLWYYPLGVLLIVGMSNAINLTDGLDGLAGGVSAIIALALGVTVVAAGGGGTWLLLFAGALAGGCVGFLWFNVHPAQVFMGDTGSLALGAALAGLAMVGKVEAPFQLYALVPWLETMSVIVQVVVFKLRKRQHGLEYAKAHRVFRRTPLHHHFEECGWRETKIVGRFWAITAVAVGLAMALTR